PYLFFLYSYGHHRDLHSFPTRRSSDLGSRQSASPVWRRQRFQQRPQAATNSAGQVLQRRRTAAQCRSRQKTASRTRPESCTAARDRKSTRLNSSHVKISYAVFCLKKKK